MTSIQISPKERSADSHDQHGRAVLEIHSSDGIHAAADATRATAATHKQTELAKGAVQLSAFMGYTMLYAGCGCFTRAVRY